jgi:hypothetical protein
VHLVGFWPEGRRSAEYRLACASPGDFSENIAACNAGGAMVGATIRSVDPCLCVSLDFTRLYKEDSVWSSPEIVDIALPGKGVFHNLVFETRTQDLPGASLKDGVRK